MSQKGIIALTIPLLLLVIIAAVVVVFVSPGVIKNPLKTSPSTVQTPTVVSLKTQYQNPFDKSSQYVNPFSTYKNPFDNLK